MTDPTVRLSAPHMRSTRGSTGVRALAALVLLGAAASAYAVLDAYSPNLDRGALLYEQYCIVCHTPRIHSRPNRIPLTRDELRGLVDGFRRMENLGWTPEEVEDVVEYLNRTRYRLPGS